MSTRAEQTVAEYFASIRAMDVERCLALFAPGAEQQDPVGAPANTGKEAIHAFFTQIFAGFQEVTVTEDSVFPGGNSVAVKWTGRGVVQNGNTVDFEGIDVIDINDEGKIIRSRSFWDVDQVMAALLG